MGPVESGIEFSTLIDGGKPESVCPGNGVCKPGIKFPALILIKELSAIGLAAALVNVVLPIGKQTGKQRLGILEQGQSIHPFPEYRSGDIMPPAGKRKP